MFPLHKSNESASELSESRAAMAPRLRNSGMFFGNYGFLEIAEAKHENSLFSWNLTLSLADVVCGLVFILNGDACVTACVAVFYFHSRFVLYF